MSATIDRPGTIPADWTAAEWDALLASLTRRKLIGGGLALGLLTACGGATPTPTANPNAGFPRTVEYAGGSATIPTKPTRIVALGDAEELDGLLAIGLKPHYYGLTKYYSVESPPWHPANALDGVARFDAPRGSQLDIEKIAGQKPDLVLGTWLKPEIARQLGGIAPTLVIKADDTTTWQAVQRLIARATGREAEAEAAIRETEAVIVAQRERLKPHASRTVTVAYQFFDQFLINGSAVSISRLVQELGLKIQAPDQAKISMLSLEQIRAVEGADLLLSPEFIANDMAKQEANPLFRSLPAVQAGRYVRLPNTVARATYLESALSVRWVVPQLATAIIAAAEGRGVKLA